MAAGLAVETRGLVKRFSASVTAVDDLELATPADETFGLPAGKEG